MIGMVSGIKNLLNYSPPGPPPLEWGRGRKGGRWSGEEEGEVGGGYMGTCEEWEVGRKGIGWSRGREGGGRRDLCTSPQGIFKVSVLSPSHV